MSVFQRPDELDYVPVVVLFIHGGIQFLPAHGSARIVVVLSDGVRMQLRASTMGISRQIQATLPFYHPDAIFQLDPFLFDDDAEEDGTGDAVHVEKVELPFPTGPLGRSCHVCTRADHLGGAALEIFGLDDELRGDKRHLRACPSNNAVPHLVLKVFPAGCVADRIVVPHFVQQLDQSFGILGRVRDTGLCLASFEETPDMAVVMCCRLREGFGNDGGLLEFEAEAEMNDRVEGALVHLNEHFLGQFGPREEVLDDSILPTMVSYLLLEEGEEGGVLRDCT